MNNKLLPLRCRENEMIQLEKLLDRAKGGKPQLLTVLGHRRVGKTFLISHFLARQSAWKTLYFEATLSSTSSELKRLNQELRLLTSTDNRISIPNFNDWESAFDTLHLVSQFMPLIVVIDEISYLAESNKPFFSIIQLFWDRISKYESTNQFILILSGSLTRTMELAIGPGGPLFNRPTEKIKLHPFTCLQGYEFVSRPDPTAYIEAYSACGGYPLHLDKWDFALPTNENLLNLAASPGSLLLEDALLLFSYMPSNLSTLLSAIGKGMTKKSELSNEVGKRIDASLAHAISSDLVIDYHPLKAPKKQTSTYRLKDTYLRFWFLVLSSYVQQIEAGLGKSVLAASASEWSKHVANTFEDAAREHAIKLVDSDVNLRNSLVGEWWTTSGQQCQVDVLGLKENKTILLGEAKWRLEPIGRRDIEKLGKAIQFVPNPVPDPYIYFWSRGGLQDKFKSDRIKGFTISDIFS